MAPITITNVKTILTAPAGIRLVVVKVETSEPGLYGLGCATFTQRFQAVAAAIDHHLKPFVIGEEVHRVKDICRAPAKRAPQSPLTPSICTGAWQT